MSKFTKDAPFEFEGVKVWPGEFNPGVTVVRTSTSQWGYESEEVVAIHAFIEAERDEWRWTNDDHTEARKGRWVAFACEGGSCDLEHDDLPGLTWYADESAVPASIAGVRESYRAWKSAQNQPSEPTGLGAVVEVAELPPCEPGATERFTLTGGSSHNQYPWVREGDRQITMTWRMLTERGPVTVLSDGVAS